MLKTENTGAELNLVSFVHSLGGPIGIANALWTRHGTPQRRMSATLYSNNNEDAAKEKN